ncbi:sugar transporter ERD6-like 16 isoform X2 [Prosopis cineraria]|uniref:sugar transporter ERD6-like 16 isoform X2 n=1 Tax=Prosopis cineraria TaxID=364024 RepID=UPI00240F6BE2|nr:sugar transporter ERD6-like 16 isoform X2 [Prosopis cineraria]
MGIDQYKDVESGEANSNRLGDLQEPFIQQGNKTTESAACRDAEADKRVQNGSINMVLLSTFVAVCGSFSFGSCVGYSAPTQAAIRADLKLSLAEYSMFGSLVTIGAMLGAVTSGRVADFMGRKGAMRMSSGFCITGWIAIFFSKVPVYIAEIAPKNLRGGLATTNQLMIVIGSSVSFLIGSVVTWRTLALSGLMPLISLLIGLCFIPESPRWLAKVGREKDFHAALGRLRGKDTDVSEEAAEIQDYIATLESLPKAQFLDLFRSKHVRSVVIGVGIMACQQAVGINGIGFYAAETFVAAGLSSSNIGTIGYACIQIPITLLGAILMDKSGRRPLIMVSASGTFLGCFITGIAFLLRGQSLLLDWVPMLAVAGVLIYIAAFSIGMGSVPWVIMSEIFPINVKGIAGSLVVLVTWLGAWIVSYTYNFLMIWNAPGTLFMYGGCSLVTILFVAKFVPETRGKTLEEIQASINS